MNDIRILIVAADPLARAGLALLLEEQEQVAVVGRVDSSADWEKTLDAYRPTAVVWDLGWEIDADEVALDQLELVDCPVLVLLPDELFVAEALDAGAHGVLLRDVEADRLAAALTAVAHNLTVLDPAFNNVYLQASPSSPLLEEDPLIEPLTPRETEVLHELAKGLTNKAIAQVLSISPHTVKFHVTSIMAKLEAQSRTEAVTRATRLGLLPL